MQYGASVIICCYNSAKRLPDTLKHLSRQKFSVNPSGTKFTIEIILVNNNSTDNTKEVAEEYRQQFEKANIQLRIIDEPKGGQMYARIKGVREARFECVIFCDDDNWLYPEYVYEGFQMMASDSLIGAGGGKVLPEPEISPPVWFEEYQRYYGTGIPAGQSGDVTKNTFVLGAGMVTRKSLFLKLFSEAFPTLLAGRNGTQLTTGDDFEFSKRLMICGYKLYYNDRMILNHFIPAERLTIAYRNRLMEGIQQAGIILKEYDTAIHIRNKVRNKSRLRLLILSPFRIFFSKMGWSKRNPEDERNVQFYLSPLTPARNSVRYILKKLFYYKIQ